MYCHNVTSKDDETASTAPAKLTYTYKIRVKSINTALLQDDTISSPYIVGDAVWSLHGRYTMQFDRGTVTRIYSPHSVHVDSILRNGKDVRPVHGENNTTSGHVTPLDYSDDEADPMAYCCIVAHTT